MSKGRCRDSIVKGTKEVKRVIEFCLTLGILGLAKRVHLGFSIKNLNEHLGQ